MNRRSLLAGMLLGPGALAAQAAAPSLIDGAECIAPAKPRGGFDLTCKLAQAGLQVLQPGSAPLHISYMPGGVGAIAFNTMVSQRPAEARTLVAFSSGSLLNLAQGRFGRRSERDVRWLAALGADYGVVIVAQKSPYKTLPDLLAALKAEPNRIAFAAGGTIGSQDWVKSVLVARAAGIDHKAMRFVAFEGGGEATQALAGGHVQVYTGDASELADKLGPGSPFRVLCVMAEQRLPGLLAQVPTAREQGLDLVWPSIRGFYMGPQVSEADFNTWIHHFERLLALPEWAALRERHGLYPLPMATPQTGAALTRYVEQQVRHYAQVADTFGLHPK